MSKRTGKDKARVRLMDQIVLATVCEKFNQQGRACAICRIRHPGTKGVWPIDQALTTRAFRGLLCSDCKVMIEKANDSPSVLREAAAYLEKYAADLTKPKTGA